MAAATDVDAVPLGDRHEVIPSGVYTVRGPSGHRTFTIERQGNGEDFAAGRRLVFLLVGRDTEEADSWKPFGFVADEPAWQAIRVWKSLRGTPSTEFERYAHLLEAMVVGGRRRFRGPDGGDHDYDIMLSRRCIRCDRRLTTPESLAAGIGPECARKGGRRP